jgi:hypothetical protein
MAPRLPTSLLQAPGGGFALAAAGSLGWDAELRCIEKLRGGRILGLRWLPFGRKTQQLTNSWRQY